MLPLLVSLVAAVVPTIIYAMLLYWADRYEREPRGLAIVSFLWGAIPTVIVALIGEMIMGTPLGGQGSGASGSMAGDAVIAPIIEELAKGCAVLALYLFRRREFDGPLDGLIYGGLVGFGFAMTENFLYFIGAFDEGGYGNLSFVIFLRTILFGLNHALYTGFTGIGFGLARNSRVWFARFLWPLIGLGAAMLAHGLHNYGVGVAGENLLGFLLSLVVAGASIGLVLLTVRLALRKERTAIREELVEEIGITVTPEEYTQMTQQWRRPWRWSKTGRAQADRMQLCAELALRKARLRRLTAVREPGLALEIEQIREQLVGSR